MESLSPEITLEVLRYLPKDDLKAVRMVCRHLRDLPSQLLFHTVYASLHLKDLQVLIQISIDPVLRLAVREVVYSAVFFRTPILKSVEAASDASMQYYRDRHTEQTRVLKGRHNEQYISDALDMMPNVRRVTLTNHWRPTRDLLRTCDFATRCIGDVATPDGSRFGGPLSRAYPVGPKQPDGRPLLLRVQDSSLLNIDYGFWMMCRAASTAKTQVQELVIDYYNDIRGPGRHKLTGGISPNSLNISVAKLEPFYNAFRHLRRIAFTLCDATTDEEWDILLQGNLAKMLAVAHDLEELTFDFISRDNDIPLHACLGTHCWPRLRLIRLYRKQIREAELTELLQRHCKSLKVLHLDSLNLTHGTWQGAAEKWHPWLNLEDIRCNRLLECVGWGNKRAVRCDELEKHIIHGESGPIVDPDYRPQTPIIARPYYDD